MEAIGAVASITGVVGFVGQIASGCNVIKNAIGDIKHAPEDIRRISKYIDSVKSASDDVLQLYENIKQHLGPSSVVGESVKDAFKAVEDLEKEISSSVAVFEDAAASQSLVTTRKKKRWPDVVHRVKYLTKKNDIEELLSWLDRTKNQVLVVQQKLSL